MSEPWTVQCCNLRLAFFLEACSLGWGRALHLGVAVTWGEQWQ